MNKKILAIAAGTALILVGFQNCSKTEFKAASDSSLGKNSTLIPLDDCDDGCGEESNNPPGGTPPLTNINPPPPTNVNLPPPPPPGPGNPGKGPGAPPRQGENEEEVSGAGDYIACIIKDHGKSLKLGLLEDGKAGGVHAVSHSICIPRQTCLVEVAKKFPVEGAYERGYCGHNPHVILLNNAQVIQLLNQ